VKRINRTAFREFGGAGSLPGRIAARVAGATCQTLTETTSTDACEECATPFFRKWLEGNYLRLAGKKISVGFQEPVGSHLPKGQKNSASSSCEKRCVHLPEKVACAENDIRNRRKQWWE
jgi:hypothetical protein